MNKENRPLKELRDSGLLWLINRVVFHPRGFALGLTINEQTGEVNGWKLLGSGIEPWDFDGQNERPAFESVEQLFADNRKKAQ